MASRSKPANRSRRTRSESSTSSRVHASRSPVPKLYPVGDGTYAPLDFILALRRERQTTVTEVQPVRKPSPEKTRQDGEHHVSESPDQNGLPEGENLRPSSRLPTVATAGLPAGLDFSTSTLRPIIDGRLSYDYDPFFSRIGSISAGFQETNMCHENGSGLASTSLGASLELPAIRDTTDSMSYLRNEPRLFHTDTSLDLSHSRDQAFLTEDADELVQPQEGLADGGSSPNMVTLQPQNGDTGTNRKTVRGRDDYWIHTADHRKKFLGASSSQVSGAFRMKGHANCLPCNFRLDKGVR